MHMPIFSAQMLRPIKPEGQHSSLKILSLTVGMGGCTFLSAQSGQPLGLSFYRSSPLEAKSIP
jgi:hypothetical protein